MMDVLYTAIATMDTLGVTEHLGVLKITAALVMFDWLRRHRCEIIRELRVCYYRAKGVCNECND